MSTQFEPGAIGPAGSIPLSVPEIRGREWEYVRDCLDTGWVSSVGSYVERFEQMCAARVGVKYAVATSTGTAALHLSLLACGVQPEEEVVVPALTFISPANAVRYVGAFPVFLDVDPEYWQLDPRALQRFLEDECEERSGSLYNMRTGRRLAAVLPVDILGHPVDMDPIRELARRFSLFIIEDSTESLGAGYRDRSVGQCGDIACLSFNGNKIITTGGGGMILTDNEEWARHARYLSTQAKDDPIEYVHGEVGFNYRLTNVQAALGVAQMELLDEYVAAKREIARRYNEAFGATQGVTLPSEAPWARSTYWMYTILIDAPEYGEDSRSVLRRLSQERIQARPLWQPLHRSPAMHAAPERECPFADAIHSRALSLPCSVGLSTSDQDRVIAAIQRNSRGD